MALTIDFANKIIYPDRSEMVQIQSSPIEIYQFNVNTFHQGMRDLEDDEEGIWADVTHNYSSPTTLSGVTYARLVEIINDYTITFLPDSAWVVQVTGGNSNVGDRVNPNNVSVQVANSAGLQDAEALQAGAFGGQVALDVNSSFSGTTFPTGTREFPVNNSEDAIAIAQSRGLGTILVVSNMVLDSADWSAGYTFRGGSAVTLTLTVGAGSDVTSCDFEHMTIEGILDGMNSIVDCTVLDVENFNGSIRESSLSGTVTLSGSTQTNVIDCYSGFAGSGPGQYATVNMGGVNNSLAVRDYHGGIEITNGGAGTSASLDIASGRVIVDSSVTDGDYTVRGIASVEDGSTGTATVNDQTISEVTDVVEKLLRNKTVTDPVTGVMTVYDDDNATPLLVAQLYEDATELQTYRGQGAEVRDRLT